MKIPYKHIVKHIDSKPDINEVSERLFQLGHENEILDDIFDIEFTPNRGDCLSLDGILRDLKIFYKILNTYKIYEAQIPHYTLEFINNAKNYCKNISFLSVEIDKIPTSYKNPLRDYFLDLDINKTNFFTDISNYISYETGQPTHCYDSSSIKQPINLTINEVNTEFITLQDQKLNIDIGDLVFKDKDNNIINLAGVIGGKETACNKNTKSVIIECAHFDPEIILGRSIKYGIKSEAAHKFERNTDPYSHEYVLKRFLDIIDQHSNIIDLKIFSEVPSKKELKKIPFDLKKINNILGTNIDEKKCLEFLRNLGFSLDNNLLEVPSYRNDINSINDLSEEVARAFGYDNIEAIPFSINSSNHSKENHNEKKIKKLLIKNGFYEVINNPFVEVNDINSVKIDNPLDINRGYLRTNLKHSLVKNLLFNERRQKDSIKLFEVSDLYNNKNKSGKKVIGIIASGRMGKNYKDFSKIINKNYIQDILNRLNVNKYEIEEIPREPLKSKLKSTIFYCEIEIKSFAEIEHSFDNLSLKDIEGKKYKHVSEFPSSSRDLSFSIKDFSKSKILEEILLNYEETLLKEVFVFDYYKNDDKNEIKIGYRFIFQSNKSTITDNEVNEIMKKIVKKALSIDSVSIPGMV